jgi:hypothetical protein
MVMLHASIVKLLHKERLATAEKFRHMEQAPRLRSHTQPWWHKLYRRIGGSLRSLGQRLEERYTLT